MTGKIKGREQIKEYLKKYSGSGVDFFTLKNDGDTARVRILHGDDQDLPLFLVHKMEVDGKDRYVECLEDGCPSCEAYGSPMLKLFIIMYDYADEKVKCWERGTSQVDHLLGFIDKYGPLNNRDYEIQRHGKRNDPKTTYQFFPLDKGSMLNADGKEIEMPKRPEIYGRFVLQMTAEDMKDHIADNAPVERKRERYRRDPF